MKYTRRQFLQHGTAFGGFSVLAVTGLMKPGQAYAQWRQQYFATGDLKQTLTRLFQIREIIDSDEVTIKAPRTAENGASVPITIKSELEGIEKVYLLVEKNPVPLSAIFQLSPLVDVYIKARIKMAESCDVIAIASDGDRLYRSKRTIKVTEGGCGG